MVIDRGLFFLTVFNRHGYKSTDYLICRATFKQEVDKDSTCHALKVIAHSSL